MTFDISKFKGSDAPTSRYEKRIAFLLSQNKYTSAIEKAVISAIGNIQTKKTRSFVIYGEPQSGKTEMMIALTAKLLDSGFKIIIVLLNDNVELLSQNLDRFIASGIDPAARNFSEILDPDMKIGDKEWVIFCKKNSKDLDKLLDKLKKVTRKIIIDDEADYASPNSKINKGEKTKINEYIEKLIGIDGIYIGVTATPARLDLNKTFENENEYWVDFPPHPHYTGQDVFFPTFSKKIDRKFNLVLLPDNGDDPKHLRNGLFRFLCNVARLNTAQNPSEKNYSMLIHTSGKKADHALDYKLINKTLETLRDEGDKKFDIYIREIWEIAKEKYPGHEDLLTKYVRDNIAKHKIVVMNSDTDKNVTDYSHATSPSSLFTIIIGGNIISRGVTFDNLLSMFFTRDTKHKIQQDTYIQRARMFGNRGPYLQFFELCIPEQLYSDWQKCFVFHKLSLSAIRSKKGSPVWLEDKRVAAISSSSVDRTAVSVDQGEMGFEMFKYNEDIDLVINSHNSSLEKLKRLKVYIQDNSFPNYLLEFIEAFLPKGNDSIVIHRTRTVSRDTDYHDTLERPKGLFGSGDTKKHIDSSHHIMIHKNHDGNARIIYKYVPNVRIFRRN